MANRSNSHELSLILTDAVTLRRLLAQFKSLPNAGVLGLAIPPLLAFFAVEVVEWLKRGGTTPRSAKFQKFDSELRALRAHLKVFDDTKSGFAGVVRRLRDAERQSVHEFNKNHNGILGPFKRKVQKDLGTYFLGNYLVCTTHIGALNAPGTDADSSSASSEPFESTSKRLFDFGSKMGNLVGAIAGAATTEIEGELQPHTETTNQLILCDEFKAGDFYAQLNANLGVPIGYGAAFTWMICQVNFTHRWLRFLLPSSSGLLFRARLLAAYHAASGLRILSSGRDRDRSTLACEVAARILGNPDTREIRRVQKLRNIMAHYDLSAATEVELASADPLTRVVERVAGTNITELSLTIDRTLELMSNTFCEVVKPSKSAKPSEDGLTHR